MKIAVIGGGPGGYVAAIKAAMHGADEVVVIEKKRVGGTCLNVGCIPTKALLASSSMLMNIKEAKSFGIDIDGDVKPNFSAIMDRKNKVVDQLIAGIEFLFNKRDIKLINGFGKLVDKNTIEVTKEDGSKEIVNADKILANGSVPVVPPMFPYDGKLVITSDEVLGLEELPESMLIVGGGVIGSEIGQFFQNLGTQVTIVEMAEHILGNEDKDVAKQLQRQFKKDKIKVLAGVGVQTCEIVDNKVVATLSNGKSVTADTCLVAVGRKPNLANSGIEEIGIELVGRGKVKVNEYLETNVEGIYAIGDIIDTAMLAHVASKEGEVAAVNALGGKKTVNYAAVPRCVYTEPEVAGVGKTEKQLQAAGEQYNVGQFDFRALGKAQAIGHIQGFIKVLADNNDKIIGASIVGPHATDLLTELSLAVGLGLTVEQVGDIIHAHPSLSEGLMEALHDVHGECVHAAPKLVKA